MKIINIIKDKQIETIKIIFTVLFKELGLEIPLILYSII